MPQGLVEFNPADHTLRRPRLGSKRGIPERPLEHVRRIEFGPHGTDLSRHPPAR